MAQDLPSFTFTDSLDLARPPPTRPAFPHSHSAPSLGTSAMASPAFGAAGAPSLGPLFLSIDGGVTKLRACVMSDRLEVVWVEEVDIDDELPEYGTRNGVYTMGDVVTSPSDLRLAALDHLLEKLARDCPDPTLLSRVVSISGAGQPYTLHYLTPAFPSLLASLAASPHSRLSAILTSSAAFSLPTPATGGDSSTSSHVRALKYHFGLVAHAAGLTATSAGEGEGESEGTAPAPSPPQLLALGRAELARRTGSKPSTRGGAAQLVKVLEADKKEAEEGRLKCGVLDPARTGSIVLESTLFASVFLGRLAPTDAADACSTNLFSPVEQDWDDDVLQFVMGGSEDGGKMLRGLLGEVETDGGCELGRISPYFVQRFGFSADCLITLFTGSDPATFLSFPLYSSPSPFRLPTTSGTAEEQEPEAETEEWRDALVSLSTSGGDTDVAMVPAATYIPGEERSVWCNPARGWWEDEEEGEQEEGGTSSFVAAVSSRDAGIGRALVRDLYANGEWKIFSHLSAIVPHGGTIGLDDKYFSFFFPHGEASVAQGFLRFVSGARVQEFPDRKANPRLLLESQAMSLRLRLSHIYRALTPALTSLDAPPLLPFDALSFPPLSPFVLPSRLILVGAPAQNPAMSSLLSTMFNAPAFLPTASGLRSFAKAGPGEEAEYEADVSGPDAAGRKKTTASALGAAYKAAWAFRRASERGTEAQVPFQHFLREAVEALAAEKTGTGGGVATVATQGEKDDTISAAGTFSSSSGTAPSSSTAPSSYLSLARRALSASASTAPSTAPSTGLPKVPEHPHRAAAAAEDEDRAELEPDPPGLTLVAMPDRDEWKYYSSMLYEFARLERYAVKGLI
ncbi:hypothetical protein JCM10207_005194 [Rhodosporidiobolus poonsookiae]